MNIADERNKLHQMITDLKAELDSSDINSLSDADAIQKWLDKIDSIYLQIKQFISRFGVNDWNSWGPAKWNYIERSESALNRKLQNLERADIQKSKKFNRRMAYSSALFAAISAIAAIFSAYSSCTSYKSKSQQNEIVTGSSVAEMGAGGAIASRKPDKSEINSVEFLRNSLNVIDRKYPGPQMPANAKKLKVLSVDSSGNILLENRRKILIEGVKCTPQGITYLQKFLTGDTDRIVYIPSSSNNQSPVRAYIWHFFSDGYNQLNEGALTSGWCVPDKSATHTYRDRYEALSRIAHR